MNEKHNIWYASGNVELLDYDDGYSSPRYLHNLQVEAHTHTLTRRVIILIIRRACHPLQYIARLVIYSTSLHVSLSHSFGPVAGRTH